ncbi:Protein NRT1/PTR FAMILY 4.6 [Abeliophyllum distichum]|uniref:Protein NRT1/PTR FAMILY 4.6 n=1 Tax=Abeliophyllum distichum TaxID=126358 RepID=A0ABD1RX52_9LAMI
MSQIEMDNEQGQQSNRWEGYIDWRNRSAIKGRHGGMVAASFILVVEVLENLAYLANASNLVLYLSRFMHFSPSKSANIVTNFMGTAFLLAFLGGFLSDAYFTTYCIFLLSAMTEFLGLVILTVQAHIPSLKPPVCPLVNRNVACEEVDRGESDNVIRRPLFGGTRCWRNKSLSCGALIAVTFVVWIEDNKGWQWGFGISTATILISIPIFLLGSATYRIKISRGSPITTIFKVLAASVYHSWVSRNSSNAISNFSTSSSYTTKASEDGEYPKGKAETQTLTEDLKFLDRALLTTAGPPWLECTIRQVEEVKSVLKVLPIFMSTIMLNCCLAQLSTFSIQQAATMNTKVGSLRIPPASLPVFPVLFIMILAPVYNHVIIPFSQKVANTEIGITHLQRIGIGLVLSIVAMAVAALVEMKRKRVAIQSGLVDSTETLPITFLWVSMQYVLLGSADLFSLAGLMDFFFTEATSSMKSLATALSWVSLAMGYYLSSVLVALVNHITGTFRHTPWLHASNINQDHLEKFYWLMCILSGLNFLHYLFWAQRYRYGSSGHDNQIEIQIVNN